jgi:hypothetical protein
MGEIVASVKPGLKRQPKSKASKKPFGIWKLKMLELTYNPKDCFIGKDP